MWDGDADVPVIATTLPTAPPVTTCGFKQSFTHKISKNNIFAEISTGILRLWDVHAALACTVFGHLADTVFTLNPLLLKFPAQMSYWHL